MSLKTILLSQIWVITVIDVLFFRSFFRYLEITFSRNIKHKTWTKFVGDVSHMQQDWLFAIVMMFEIRLGEQSSFHRSYVVNKKKIETKPQNLGSTIPKAICHFISYKTSAFIIKPSHSLSIIQVCIPIVRVKSGCFYALRGKGWVFYTFRIMKHVCSLNVYISVHMVFYRNVTNNFAVLQAANITCYHNTIDQIAFWLVTFAI